MAQFTPDNCYIQPSNAMSTCLQSAQTIANCYPICALDIIVKIYVLRIAASNPRSTTSVMIYTSMPKERGYNYPSILDLRYQGTGHIKALDKIKNATITESLGVYYRVCLHTCSDKRYEHNNILLDIHFLSRKTTLTT